ncbi:bifunctional nucleoside/nucleotide kinase/histidine phosphatase family protein KNAG_0H02190 [Huiozyma naganishii CBS 8797]|uniref:6-phosphofructo-2-kinase domain-containing protein n=1 Tax=Huiozyma naganishii (strain ATCC MYA-139 / BCRC 22969 / CBS 8797 / KCTC 17520 / NBRC 10181 / NCYC 3082 / Yp74L-3) TaxID=1071383 RepID=J7S1T8_HUIN7|nr:hypothetical protein KNAG_0H02190 [Kazachstania naganishii CBS 8797]CCK71632.1 hypothetical protein KNAG_0H02190 [Kazachstania naganishii CBS 8797]
MFSKHRGKLPTTSTHRHMGDTERTGLPEFQKRPLGDTPVDTRVVSPQEGSPPPKPPRWAPNRPHSTLSVPGWTASRDSPDGLISRGDSGSKLLVVMVGLPAMGKSFITGKLARFLNYSMYACEEFHIADTRRRWWHSHATGSIAPCFFDERDPRAQSLRDEWALDTLDRALEYLLEGDGSVAVVNGTNITARRRALLMARVRSRSRVLDVMFLESICSDEAVIERNVQLKASSADYRGWKDSKLAVEDFRARLAHYRRDYEPLEDNERLQYVKMIDVGKKVIANGVRGYLASLAVYYLLNFNLATRQVWVTRNGESEDNVAGRVGGDSHLTVRGQRYARALHKFIDTQRSIQEQEQRDNREFFVWTSMLQRAIETSHDFENSEYPLKQMRMLDEINAGDFDGLTNAQIEQIAPREYKLRQCDKLRYRYPGTGGESYLDVINRVRPVITEIERLEDSVLLITHRVVARVLLGYFMSLKFDAVTQLDVPLHCVYKLDLLPYGIKWTLYEYDEVKDTFRELPTCQMNVSRMEQMGGSTRRFSMVPTAPSTPTTASTASTH